jgi:hypothetical protein
MDQVSSYLQISSYNNQQPPREQRPISNKQQINTASFPPSYETSKFIKNKIQPHISAMENDWSPTKEHFADSKEFDPENDLAEADYGETPPSTPERSTEEEQQETVEDLPQETATYTVESDSNPDSWERRYSTSDDMPAYMYSPPPTPDDEQFTTSRSLANH